MVQDTQKRENPFDGHYAFTTLLSMSKDAWIIDSGASDHICSDLELFHSIYRLSKPVKMHLPDGSTQTVGSAGKVKLNKDIKLIDVLYIQGFTHNLLSVTRLIQDFGIKCVFYKTHYLF